MRQGKGWELDWRGKEEEGEKREGRSVGEEEERTVGKPHGENGFAETSSTTSTSTTTSSGRRRRGGRSGLAKMLIGRRSEMPLLLFLFLLLLSPPASSSRPDASLCPLSEYIDDNEETVREFFECPGLEDPPNYRACCEEKCCPVVDSVLQVDIRIAMVISLTVICACVVTGVAIVVCCFVSPCPLYDACSGSGGWKHPPPMGYPGGYIPSDMHPLTLNGSKDSSLERDYKLADGINPVKVVEADHV